MQFFRDMSVRTKLFGGFGGVLLLTTVLGVMMITQIGSVNATAHTVAARDFPSVVMIDKVATTLNDYNAMTYQGMIQTTPSVRAADEAGAAQDATTIDGYLSSYAKYAGPGQDTTDWHAVQRQWAAYQMKNKPLLAANVTSDAAIQALVGTLDDQTFTPLQNLVGSWSVVGQKIAAAGTRASASTYSSARTLGIGLLVLVLMIGMGIAFLVSRSIKQAVDIVLERLTSIREHCIKYLSEGMEAFAAGDLTRSYTPVTKPIENPSKDEIGQVATAVNAVRDRVVASLEAYNKTAERLRETIGRVAQTAGSVGSSSRQMVSTSDETGRATGEIAQAVGDVAQGAERQVRMVEAARHSAEDVTRAVTESAESARQTAEVAQETRKIALEGVGAAEQANEAMRSVRDSSQAVSTAIGELASKSEQIGAIVATITGIAEQTNLLALNAAIEAARAGEQGRGFAVVAEEVRKLAEESQGAAAEISSLIGAIQEETTTAVSVVEDGARRTEEGAGVVELTREAFQRIESSVDEMTARIEQIAAASQQVAASANSMQQSIAEVAAVAEESSASTEQVSASTEQTSAAAQQIAASAQELSGNAEELNGLVAQFKVTAG